MEDSKEEQDQNKINQVLSKLEELNLLEDGVELRLKTNRNWVIQIIWIGCCNVVFSCENLNNSNAYSLQSIYKPESITLTSLYRELNSIGVVDQFISNLQDIIDTHVLVSL